MESFILKNTDWRRHDHPFLLVDDKGNMKGVDDEGLATIFPTQDAALEVQKTLLNREDFIILPKSKK